MKPNNVYKIGNYIVYMNEVIGAGSYSKVYLGKCLNNEIIQKYDIIKKRTVNGRIEDNIVAVKKIVPEEHPPKYQKMIDEECNLMNSIKINPHPNIISCYDVIDDLDTIYIIMEYCECGDFSSEIGFPMKDETIKYYLKQIVNGVKYLDDNGIIHRDIKPKNLLLTDDKKIKICDFGLAKSKVGLSRIHTVCGSPLYMAPEMFSKNYYDTVDLWSIGIIMYEMVYGVNPLSKIRDLDELEDYMLNNKDEIIIPPTFKKKIFASNDCIILLKTLLTKESSKRLSLSKLCSDVWLNDGEFNVDNEIEYDRSEIQDNNNDKKNAEYDDKFDDQSSVLIFTLEDFE